MKIALQSVVGWPLVAALMLSPAGLGTVSAADEALKALDLRQVKVGGEIGRRIDVTVRNNLLVLDTEKDFLAHFRSKDMHEGYIGLGKLLDAAVRLAAYTHDEKVIAFKQRLVEEAIKVQEPDGYIGTMAAPNRMWGLWDIHEMGYIIYALTSDYHYFGQQRSVAAARKAADYILGRWAKKPAEWPEKYHWATSVALTGFERTLLASIGKRAIPAISISASVSGPCPTGRPASSSAAANRSKAIPIPISSAAWRNWSSTASSRTSGCCGSAGEPSIF